MIKNSTDKIKENLISAIEVFLPVKCMICGKSTPYSHYNNLSECFNRIVGGTYKLHICADCLTNLVAVESDERWNFCLSNPIPNDPYPELPLYIAFSYDGIMRRIVTNLKFRGVKECGYFAGILLGKMLEDDEINVDMVIPMPLHPKRYIERGYNQAEIIAHSVSKVMGIPLINDILMREKFTERQSEIKDVNERISNVSKAFRVSEDWDVVGSSILLIDDVVTTGFTMHEAAIALLDAGASKVLCCAVAGNRLLKNADRF